MLIFIKFIQKLQIIRITMLLIILPIISCSSSKLLNSSLKSQLNSENIIINKNRTQEKSQKIYFTEFTDANDNKHESSMVKFITEQSKWK